MVQHHLPTDLHLQLHTGMVSDTVGVNLHAQVSVLGPVGLGPRPPVLAFGLGDGGVHGVVNPPWFIAQPCRDMIVVDVHVFCQPPVE